MNSHARRLLFSKAFLTVVTVAVLGSVARAQAKSVEPLAFSLGMGRLSVDKESLPAVNAFSVRVATHEIKEALSSQALSISETRIEPSNDLSLKVGEGLVPQSTSKLAEDGATSSAFSQAESASGALGTASASSPTGAVNTDALSGPITNAAPEPSLTITVLVGALMLGLTFRYRRLRAA